MKIFDVLVRKRSSLFLLILFGFGYLYVVAILNNPVNLSDDLQLDAQGRYLLSIEKGSNLKRVNAELSRYNIIPSDFVALGRVLQTMIKSSRAITGFLQ